MDVNLRFVVGHYQVPTGFTESAASLSRLVMPMLLPVLMAFTDSLAKLTAPFPDFRRIY